jgi:hypothetical protein
MSSTISSSDQKKSLVFTILLYATMLLILFSYTISPANIDQLAGGGGGGGVTVNFGDSDLGSGAN